MKSNNANATFFGIVHLAEYFEESNFKNFSLITQRMNHLCGLLSTVAMDSFVNHVKNI